MTSKHRRASLLLLLTAWVNCSIYLERLKVEDWSQTENKLMKDWDRCIKIALLAYYNSFMLCKEKPFFPTAGLEEDEIQDPPIYLEVSPSSDASSFNFTMLDN